MGYDLHVANSLGLSPDCLLKVPTVRDLGISHEQAHHRREQCTVVDFESRGGEEEWWKDSTELWQMKGGASV